MHENTEIASPYDRISALLNMAMRGCVSSICLVGCLRAWLSFLSGICLDYQTCFAARAGVSWIIGPVLVVGSILLLFPPTVTWSEHARRTGGWAIGITGSVLYVTGLLAADDHPVLTGFVGVTLALLFLVILRIWCNDNAGTDPSLTLVRLGISFLFQYVVYTLAIVMPPLVQCGFAALLPLAMGSLLTKPPAPIELENVEAEETEPLTHRSLLFYALVVFSCCFAHGLLLVYTKSVSGLWVVGSLVALVLAIGSVYLLRGKLLLKGFMGVTLFAQGLSVVIMLLFAGSVEGASLAKSLSYAVSMLLALSLGCTLARHTSGDKGRFAFMWMTLYFLSFHSATYFVMYCNPPSTSMLAIILICLLVIAVSAILYDKIGLSLKSREPQDKFTSEPDDKVSVETLVATHELTAREASILQALLAGLSLKEIATRDIVSVNTVRSQVQTIYRKLGVHGRNELIELLS